MKSVFDEGQPIFQQVADMIEDDILNGTYRDDDQIISVNQFVKTFQINPATVVKGINLLVTRDILYKKRGLGMFVAQGAREKIIAERRGKFLHEFMAKLIDEAHKLRLTKEDLIRMINEDERSWPQDGDHS